VLSRVAKVLALRSYGSVQICFIQAMLAAELRHVEHDFFFAGWRSDDVLLGFLYRLTPLTLEWSAVAELLMAC
jgi:hypothetical protein